MFNIIVRRKRERKTSENSSRERERNFCLQFFMFFFIYLASTCLISTTWWFLYNLRSVSLPSYAFSFRFLIRSYLSQCRAIGRWGKTCFLRAADVKIFLSFCWVRFQRIKIEKKFSVQFYAWRDAFSQIKKIKVKKCFNENFY